MNELITAFALVLVIEGLLYAAFPRFIKRHASRVLGRSEDSMRLSGVVFLAIGVGLIWVIKS